MFGMNFSGSAVLMVENTRLSHLHLNPWLLLRDIDIYTLSVFVVTIYCIPYCILENGRECSRTMTNCTSNWGQTNKWSSTTSIIIVSSSKFTKF